LAGKKKKKGLDMNDFSYFYTIRQKERIYEAGRYQIRTVITDQNEHKPIDIVDLTEIYSWEQASRGKGRSMANALVLLNRRIRSKVKRVYVRIEYGCAISKGMEKYVTDNIVLDMIGTYWELPKYDKEGNDLRERKDHYINYFFDTILYKRDAEEEEARYTDISEVENDDDEDEYSEEKCNDEDEE
jgi:hypothetical protein